MKYINILLATLLCAATAPYVQAQRLPVKPTKIKVLKLPVGTIPKGAVPGIKVKVPYTNPQFKAKVIQLPVAQLRVAVDKKARDIQHQLALQRAAGITPQQVWINDVETHRAAILASYHLPQNYIEGFYMRRIDPYRSRPEQIYHPDKNSDKVLYRGMIITPEELTAILKKGFSPKDSTWNTGTDERGAAVSLSSSYNEASHYIFQSGYKKDGIGVVFVVKRKPTMELGKDPELNSTKTIYYSYEDIPASDILDVYIHGEYGPESLSQIVEKINAGTTRPHTSWTNQFDRGGFLR
ncbi:hypothetical protein [Candidatus Avelusimicrobium sp.]|uniref:hypothetical protein n=1 Tax=Candidatus Avelusimicrobium sp. TaxID=3048833 RepID=UPI003D7D8F19